MWDLEPFVVYPAVLYASTSNRKYESPARDTVMSKMEAGVALLNIGTCLGWQQHQLHTLIRQSGPPDVSFGTLLDLDCTAV